MHPVLSINIWDYSWNISSYKLFLTLAVAAVIACAYIIAVRRGLPRGHMIIWTAGTALSVPVGARLLHGLNNQAYYAKHIEALWSLHATGLALYGGLILAVITGFILCRVLGLPLWSVADAAAPGLGVGIALAKLGCFLNGCCFGRATDFLWGITFPAGSPAHLYQMKTDPGQDVFGLLIFGGQPVHPTQLLEIAGALVGMGLALYVLTKGCRSGMAFLTFVIWFTLVRWSVYYLRAPAQTFDRPEYWYPVIYGAILIFSGVMLWLRLNQRREDLKV